jgi:hypothetical protein
MTALDNAPTRERDRRSHFVSLPAIGTEMEQARAGLRLYRALSPIERMHRDGSLSDRQADAGATLRDDYELGIAGAHDSLGGHAGAALGYGYAERRLTAVRAYQEACQAIGPRLSAIVVPIVTGIEGGGDISVAALARLLGRNRQEVAGQLKLGLDMLADHYGLA